MLIPKKQKTQIQDEQKLRQASKIMDQIKRLEKATIKDHSRLSDRDRQNHLKSILQMNKDLRQFIPLLQSSHIKEQNLKRFEKRFEQSHYTLGRLRTLLLRQFPRAKGKPREAA